MEITKKTISYDDANGLRHDSYYCAPKDAKNAVGILVAPEWWGLTELAKKSAERLAELGYSALAMDVYGEGRLTRDAGEAAQWMNAVTGGADILATRATEALQALANQPEVDARRLAAIGYCFGGRVALDLARSGGNVKAVTTFHGALITGLTVQKGAIKAKLLIEHGSDDTMVTPDNLTAFRSEMDAADADYRVDLFKGAKHGFTNPASDENAVKNGIDVGYQKEAAEKSWANMLSLFNEVF